MITVSAAASTSAVAAHPPADPAEAVAHYAGRLRFEADCADVAADLASGAGEFALLDCRRPELFAAGHLPGAINIPPARITAELLERLIPRDRLIVTYCNGPHCNASTRGALILARLGRPVKEMPGGLDGWVREGLAVLSS